MNTTTCMETFVQVQCRTVLTSPGPSTACTDVPGLLDENKDVKKQLLYDALKQVVNVLWLVSCVIFIMVFAPSM